MGYAECFIEFLDLIFFMQTDKAQQCGPVPNYLICTLAPIIYRVCKKCLPIYGRRFTIAVHNSGITGLHGSDRIII